MKVSTMTYTIEKIKATPSAKFIEFAIEVAKESQLKYKTKYAWGRFDFENYSKTGCVLACKRNDQYVGLMIFRLGRSIFDSDVRILSQDLLYAKPGTRAAYYLMKEFIDFGKRNADHIITMIAEHTNIKPKSLEKLGFKKLETMYRIEVNDGTK